MSGQELSAREQAERAVQQGKMFIAQTRTKMKQLVDDFANGKLNREQFHTLYDRYQSQINGVKLILAENDPTMWIEALDDDETVTLRKRLLAKATGLVIYTNSSGALLDKLGKFNVSGVEVADLLEKFKKRIDAEISKDDVADGDQVTQHRYHQYVVELQPHGWLLLVQGRLTKIITSFSREPTQDQRDTMIRLLRDFESANAVHLQKPDVTAKELAMPFRVIVQREVR
jgi:hypothetical protein